MSPACVRLAELEVELRSHLNLPGARAVFSLGVSSQSSEASLGALAA